MLKRLKMAATAALAVALLAATACSGGGKGVSPAAPAASTGTKGQAKYDSNGYRIIRVASWYDYGDMYSSAQVLGDLSGYQTNPESYTARFKNLKAVEERNKVKFEFVRTTFEGIQVSLDEGVLSGMPEADIYEADIQFGMPAALNEYCYPIEDITTPDNDVFTNQQVFKALKFPSQDKTYLWSFYAEDVTVYCLGFNWTLLQAKGLENPQNLWDRGEWTWDKLKDYATTMTDLSASPPVYGFTGLWPNHLHGLLRSNATQIAATPEGGLTSAATGQVFDLWKQMYVDLKVGRPWDSNNWEPNNRYSDGTAAFFTAANWILNSDNENYGGGMDYPLNYELGVVPYPVGPNGNKDTNYHNSVQGNYFLIPKGVENPADVYRAFFELRNWYGGDFENTKTYDVIDSDDVPLTWTEQVVIAAANGNETLADNNVRLVNMMMQKISFDPWESLSINAGGDTGGFSVVPIINGEMTPAQVVETFKQPLADALSRIYK